MSYSNQNTARHRILRYILGGVNKTIWNWEPDYSFLQRPDKVHEIKKENE